MAEGKSSSKSKTPEDRVKDTFDTQASIQGSISGWELLYKGKVVKSSKSGS